MVNHLHNRIAYVSARVVAWQWREGKLLQVQLPGSIRTMNKMSGDGQVWVADL
jgi:hypothetical protein